MKRRNFHLTMVLACVASNCFAQEIEIDKVSLNGVKAVIDYNLKDDNIDRRYTLNIYSSKDNFIVPLEHVSGDVGLEVKPGFNKKITVDLAQEFGVDFQGQVAFEIRGRLFVEFVSVEGFENYRTIKRGQPWDIIWRGGAGSQVLTFELYDGVEPTEVVFPNVANEGNVTLEIPTSVKPGKQYRFKISDKRNKDDVVFTDYFGVKRKVPLMMKLIPAIAGTVLIATLAGSSPKETGTNPKVNDIPDPINPN